MPFSVFYSLTLTAALTTWSPGPNNILLLSNASKYGLKKNLKFMCGIWTGSFSLMLLCGVCTKALTSIVPGIRSAMTCIGAAYLLYLSYATLKRLPPGEERDTKEPTYKMGFMGALGNILWAFAGNVLKQSYERHYRGMNACMALLLVWCALRVLGIL